MSKKVKLSDVVVQSCQGGGVTAITAVDPAYGDQFDELLDYVVEELGVDPQEIIKRMEWHMKNKVASVVEKKVEHEEYDDTPCNPWSSRNYK